ncbi:hypothetical protein CALCODRAFT_496112 [Calocera cornea HHB12733]|uniref:Uncharacterized protein n=1 Tax=Calocera cornea HHB12733 TaxID=1353952 RepID=A0A165G120_9BASI|nr:hypothetical protein CALCODRAFT_496112 [Calocera cornea HHB12733]
MAVLDEIDPELMRLWSLISELSDQLTQNRQQVVHLQQQADQVKGQAVHCGSGFALRRWNTDISKEVFESELERMNAHLVVENQTLNHENKQLNILLKEYEQALDVIMTKFRTHAHSTQTHDLALTRHYEALLLTSQSALMNSSLQTSAQQTESLARLSHLLRAALRSLQGEPGSPDPSPPGSPSSPEKLVARGLAPPEESGDWNLDREVELARLEAENSMLRSLLGIAESSPEERRRLLEDWERENERPLGGQGAMSPFAGMGKRRGPRTFSRGMAMQPFVGGGGQFGPPPMGQGRGQGMGMGEGGMR